MKIKSIFNKIFKRKPKFDNPFDALISVYNQQVEKADSYGFADKFKDCAERFFKTISSDFVDDTATVTVEDINYLDGYFLFGFGSNSVVHFHIKECPGWIFAIWWDKPEDKNATTITGKFFTQYEETLDKFKPSRSEFSSEIYVEMNFEQLYEDDYGVSCYDAMNIINFIMKEPYLAFCRDYRGWDYNQEYHTREEAEEEYRRYRTWKDNKIKWSNVYDQKILDLVKEKVMSLFNGAVIHDDGENTSPRYQLVAPFSKNKHLVEKPGCYEWFDENDEYAKSIMDEYDSICEEGEKCSDEYKYMWYSPVSRDIVIYDDAKIQVDENGEIVKSE